MHGSSSEYHLKVEPAELGVWREPEVKNESCVFGWGMILLFTEMGNKEGDVGRTLRVPFGLIKFEIPI